MFVVLAMGCLKPRGCGNKEFPNNEVFAVKPRIISFIGAPNGVVKATRVF